MVLLHHRLKPAGLARERALLATPLPPDAELPHVVVQIPSFNEGPVVRRGVEAAARLDWPRDKLHIQILDDSTDATAEIARTVAAELRAKGFDVVALQRTDRSGYKGGALHEAMQQTPYDYFAIFDVDYVPPPDFLRRCMAVFVAEPKAAFVQARFDFLNPHENALTEMQMVTLDAHLGIEQATRCWAGHPLPFNGTCGIWQRAAIEAGGGWKGDTVTEDLDLTYRGWVKGWRAVFLTSVAVPGELPADTQTWLRQQQRWQDGFRHVGLRMFPVILKSRDIGPAAKGAALLHLCMALNQPVLLVGVVSGILAGLLDAGADPVPADGVRRDRGLGDLLRHHVPARRPQLHPPWRDAAGPLRRRAAALRRRAGGDGDAQPVGPRQEGAGPAQAGRVRPHAEEGRVGTASAFSRAVFSAVFVHRTDCRAEAPSPRQKTRRDGISAAVAALR